MNRAQMRSALSDVIQDDSYSSDDLNSALYQAALYIAGAVLLPDFKRLGSISTTVGQPYTSLSSLTGGFGGRIVKFHKAGIKICPSLEELVDSYAGLSDNEELTTAGEVEAVAQEGNTLWYQYVPATAESLIVTYYRNPPEFSSDSYEPDYIPEYLHRKIFVNGAAWLIYSDIEDDLDDVKINTTVNYNESFNEGKRDSGISKLREWIVRSRIPHISSAWDV
jgi:hypothetical protein